MLSNYLSLFTSDYPEALLFSLKGGTKGKRQASRSVREKF